MTRSPIKSFNESGSFVDYVEPEEPGYYFYEYSVGGNTGSIWSDVDRYLTYVAVCAIDSTDNRNPGTRRTWRSLLSATTTTPRLPKRG